MEVTRQGQARLQLATIPRQYPAAWDRKPCAACARAGVDRPGEPRYGTGSEPLCMSCWRGHEAREQRRMALELEALGWEQVGELATAAACAVCGSDEPSFDCWRCESEWLREARWEYELEQALAAEEAAREAARIEAEFARLAKVAEAEGYVSWLEGVAERARTVIEAYTAGHRKGRAVVLLADLMARAAATRTTMRGRPGTAFYAVGAVMALDSDWRSGRRSMPGRMEAALLAGCQERTVTNVWRSMVALGWATRTQEGRKLKLDERMELGRSNNRACYDLSPVHRSPVSTTDRGLWEPLALATLGDLAEHTLTLLRAAQADLDVLRGFAEQHVDPAEKVRRTQLRVAVSSALAAIPALPTAADIDLNLFSPRSAFNSQYVSSCLYWGYTFSVANSNHLGGGSQRPGGRKGRSGASRSSTGASAVDLERPGARSVRQPRTVKAVRRRRHPAPPAWLSWALPLAQDLVKLWPWLSGIHVRWVAAVLGSRLSGDWTAADVDGWVHQQHGRLLDDPAKPARYLATLLDKVLSGEHTPPHPARGWTEHRRQAVLQQRAELVEQAEARQAAQAAVDAAAALSPAGVSARAQARALAGAAAANSAVKAGGRRSDTRRGPRSVTAPAGATVVATIEPPAVADAPTECEVSIVTCSGTARPYVEPWQGGRVRHYCATCHQAIAGAW